MTSTQAAPHGDVIIGCHSNHPVPVMAHLGQPLKKGKIHDFKKQNLSHAESCEFSITVSLKDKVAVTSNLKQIH